MGECVLVVDDDREIVRAIGILLEGEGYEVLKAYDGLQALDILSAHPVRLVLIDVMMPRLDGLSALMRIKAEYPHHCFECKERGQRQGAGIVHGGGRLCG